MNLFDTTYPPPTTSIPPTDPSSTASTGAPASISMMVPGIFVLVILGATALRIASNRTRKFKHGV